MVGDTATMLSKKGRYIEAMKLYEEALQGSESEETNSCLKENIEQLRSAEAERSKLARIREARRNSTGIHSQDM